MKKYLVVLTGVERAALGELVERGKAAVRRVKHAQVLLRADTGEEGPGWRDERIAEAAEVSVATVKRVRQRFVEEGLEAALSHYRAGGHPTHRKLDGEAEAHLIELARSSPPQGRTRWTLRLLASRMVELQYVKAVSHETVRQTLKIVSDLRHDSGGASVLHGRPGALPGPHVVRLQPVAPVHLTADN